MVSARLNIIVGAVPGPEAESGKRLGGNIVMVPTAEAGRQVCEAVAATSNEGMVPVKVTV